MAGQPVSGPGALSKRTDKGPVQKIRDVPGGAYGDRKALNDLQHDAPLNQSPAQPPPGPAPSGGGAAGPGFAFGQGLTPLSAPTTRPNEPVTAGSPMGAGPGPEAMGLPSPTVNAYQSTRDYIASVAAQQPDNPVLAFLAQQVQGRM